MLIVALPLAIGFLWNTLKGKVEGKKLEDKTMIWLCLLLVIGVILVGITKCS